MIRPLGVYHRTRRGFGQQACPHCLREDQPYFRLNWRLRLVTCCTVHGCVLIEACPSCAAPIVPHRGGLVNCDQCGVHLGDCEPAFADNRVLQLQTEIERVLMGKAVMWPFLMGMPPILFFRLLMQLLRALSSKSWGRRLRAEVEKYIGPITLDYTDKVGHLRFLSTQSTHQGLRGVELLLQGWPAMFAGICQDARAWATWIMPEEYSDQCPFTLRTALDTYLRPGSSNKLR